MDWVKMHIKYFFSHFANAMALLSTFCTILVGMFSCMSNCPCIWWACLGLSIFYALVKLIPVSKISLHLGPRKDILIEKRDLFAIKQGIIVIPVNDYFDTQLTNAVIAANSVHGQFIKYFERNFPQRDLDNEIKQALARDGIMPSGHRFNRMGVNNDKSAKYELGTIARIMIDNLQFYLVVATEFDVNNHVINQPEKLSFMLMQMLKNIDTYNSGHPVYMPLIGSGQSGYNLGKEASVRHLLQCVSLANHYVTTGGTTICIYKDDSKDISLNKIKYDFQNC